MDSSLREGVQGRGICRQTYTGLAIEIITICKLTCTYSVIV